MSRIIEWGRQFFGIGTVEHIFEARVGKNGVEINIELKQPKGTMVVRYKPGTRIHFESEGHKYRKFGVDEEILAKEINFYGEGMSNRITINDDYFKALDDPSEVTPLIDITPTK